MNARQTRASAVRRQCRIGKIKRAEELLRRAINEHRLLEPMQCDVEFMGTDYQPKMAAYRSRHDRLLQAFAELTCERMALTEPNEATEMNERELLKLCQDAFLATQTSAESRKIIKIIKTLDVNTTSYAGDSRNILARHMADMIQKHFDRTRPDK